MPPAKGRSKRGTALETPDKIKAQIAAKERLDVVKQATAQANKKKTVAKLKETLPLKTAEEVETMDPSEKRRKINNGNRNRGRNTETTIANKLGGHRVPLSGAIKNTNFQLTGDVRVRDQDDITDFLVLEVKNSSQINVKGDRTFTLKASVVQQAIAEAEQGGNVGAVRLHWAGLGYDEDLYIIKAGPAHLDELIRLARLGKKYERLLNEGRVSPDA